MKKEFRENRFFEAAALNANVDRAAGVIRNVSMLSVNSLNGRKYPEEVQKKALPLFEGCKCYKNHLKPGSPVERSVDDIIGQFTNCRVTDGITFGDLTLVDYQEKLYNIAEKAPRLMGFSSDLSGYSEAIEDIDNVTEITRVHSVDLVTDPAATKGLFESIDNKDKEEIMEISKATLADVKKEAPQLYEQILTEGKTLRDGEVKILTEERDALKTDKATRELSEKVQTTKASVDKLLKESELKEALVTDSFKEILYNLQEKEVAGAKVTIDEQAKKLIEDRVLVQNGGVKNNYEHRTKPDNDKDKPEDKELQEVFNSGENARGFVTAAEPEKE